MFPERERGFESRPLRQKSPPVWSREGFTIRSRIGLRQGFNQRLLFLCIELRAVANHLLNRGRPLVSSFMRRGDPVQVMADRAAFLQERLTVKRGRGRRGGSLARSAGSQEHTNQENQEQDTEKGSGTFVLFFSPYPNCGKFYLK